MTLKKIIIIYLITCLLMSINILAFGACTGSSPTWSSTPDYTSVNSCVGQASAGDTINVSADSATWSSVLVITKPINLIGAGIGNTVITGAGGLIIKIYPADWSSTTLLYRISGFSFNLNTDSVGMLIGADTFSSQKIYTQDTPALPKIRIDHNRFYNSHDHNIKAIENRCHFSGVVDNNQFDDVYYPIRNDSQGSCAAIASMWQYCFSHWAAGNDYTMYYEDNVFTGVIFAIGDSSIVMDGQFGARYVARYNTFTTLSSWDPAFDEHGEYGDDMVAGFGIELYGNSGLSQSGRFGALRGGQCLAFLNQGPSGGSASFSVQQDACPCDNSGLSGFSAYWPYMMTHDAYMFGNRNGATGSLFTASVTRSATCAGDTRPAAGQEYFTDTSSPAVTMGTLGNIPGTCSVGQGYWATDQSTSNLSDYVGAVPTTPISGTLYKCTSTNNWTAFYTPYTYPHPLRDEEEADETAPEVTEFVIPSTSESFTITITTFTAYDAVGVTGYLVNESDSIPSVDDENWSESAPETYIVDSEGTKTLYAWAKDAAGNISDSSNDSCTVTLPEVSYSILSGCVLSGGVVY